MHNIAVFEDEPFLQYMWEVIAEEYGCKVVSVSSTIEDGVIQARQTNYEVAILDVDLYGTSSDDILNILEARGIPVLVCSGLSRDDLPLQFMKHDVISKPFQIQDAGRRLRKLCGMAEVDSVIG